MRIFKITGLLLLLLLLTGVLNAQEGDDFVPNPDLVAQMDDIEATTTGIRGLEGLEAVTRKFPTREDVRAYLDEQLEGEENEKLYHEATQFYIAFDLLPAGADLLTLYKDFLGQQIGGYYDTEVKEMNVVLISGNRPSFILPVLEQITYAHEYTHVLQDQHFDLDSLLDEDFSLENPDGAQARLSLIEGDATYVMNEYTVRITQEAPLLVLMQVLIQGAASGSLTIPAGTPRIIERELLSPYLDGLNFVEALIADGGLDRVNEAYSNPPQSTEHIIHPDRYLAGDNPVEVSLQVDENPFEDENWTLLFDRTLGEFFLREYLDTQLAPLDVIDAATGWGGDRYHLYYNAVTDQRAWVLKLEWDSERDAEEFADAYVNFGDLRFETSADAEGCWSNLEDAVCFTTVDGVSYISYAPTLEMAQRLLVGQLEPVMA